MIRFSALRLRIVAVVVCVPAMPALANFRPFYARDHVNAFAVADVARDPRAGITVDGDLADWRDEAFVGFYPSAEFATNYGARMAWAYDATGLLIAARFTDRSPMLNHVDPHTRPKDGWNGDALQFRVVPDASVRRPFRPEVATNDRVAHLTLWYFTDGRIPALDIRCGVDLQQGKQHLKGDESGLVFRPAPAGEPWYTMEGRIPWERFRVTVPPAPGDRWVAALQLLFSDDEGKLAFNFYECVRAAGYQHDGLDCWGELRFVAPADAAAAMQEHASFARRRSEREAMGSEVALAELAERVLNRVDWNRPELKDAAFAGAYREGRTLEAAKAFIRHLRERKTPVLEYSPEYVQLVRAHATDEQRATARAKWAKDQGGDDIAYILGPSREDFLAWARKVLDSYPQWGTSGWGTTRSVTRELSKAFYVPECPDEALIPWFAKLLDDAEGEWTSDRNWGDHFLTTEGHNWFAVAYRGFMQAGLYFPEFKPLSRFRSLTPTWIEREILQLFDRDGFSKEHAGYHWVGNDILSAFRVAKINGTVFSPECEERVKAIAEVDWKIIGPDGGAPEIGDGYARHNGDTGLGRLRVLAALYGVGESKWVAERLAPGWKPPFDGRVWPHYGRDILPDYLAVQPVEPRVLDTCLPVSGFYMIREDWTTNADYACLDVAPRGNSVNSHDHSSLFQLMLTSKGRALITNNGSGPYDGSPARMFRRSSAGHSTTTVDGKSSVPITGDMSFDAVIAPVIQDWISQPRYAYLGAVHEGYRRTANVPAVRRKVFYLRGGYWIILDRFSSGATGDEHAYEAHFHISAPVRLTPDGQAVTEGAGGNLVILQPDGARGEVKLEDCPFPLKGYANPRHLSFTQKRKGHGLMATVLVPFLDDRAPDVKVTALDVEQDDRWVTPYETTALEIVINGVRDVYVDQHMHWNLPWKAGGSIGDARLYHSRLTPRP